MMSSGEGADAAEKAVLIVTGADKLEPAVYALALAVSFAVVSLLVSGILASAGISTTLAIWAGAIGAIGSSTVHCRLPMRR